MKFHPVIPILRSFDERKAREFYIEWLGFKLDWEHRFDPGAPLFMQVSRGTCVLDISEHHGDATPGSAVRIRVDGLADFHAELESRPYKNYRPGLEDQERGCREMTVQDGSGNKLIFFEDLPKP